MKKYFLVAILFIPSVVAFFPVKELPIPDHGVLYVSEDIEHYTNNTFGPAIQVVKDLFSYYTSDPLFTVLDYATDPAALNGPHDVKWSPDGKHAAIAGKAGSLALVSADPDGKIVIKDYKTYQDDPALVDVQTVEWSSDGKYVFVGTKDYFLSYSWDGDRLSRAGAATDEKIEQINGMYIVGKYAFTASKANYIHAIDISDPETPVILVRFDTVNDGLMAPHDVAGWGDYIAVADQYRGVAGRLYIYKVMENGSLLSKSEWSAKDSLHHKLMDGANRLEVFNSQLYVMNNISSTIIMVDISDPDSINLSVVLDSGDVRGPSGSAPVYDDKWLLVASDDSISVFDVERTDTMRMVAKHKLRFLTNSSGSGHDLSINNGLGIGTGQEDDTIFTFRINTS